MQKSEEEKKKNVNDYNGYSLFNDVSNLSLQSWNRCNVMMNITEAHGNVVAEKYANALDEAGRVKVLFMFNYIKVHGWDAVNSEISRENNE